MTEKRRCDTCTAWAHRPREVGKYGETRQQLPLQPEFGECRKLPPMPDGGNRGRAGWPTTQGHDWCLQHERRIEAVTPGVTEA